MPIYGVHSVHYAIALRYDSYCANSLTLLVQ